MTKPKNRLLNRINHRGPYTIVIHLCVEALFLFHLLLERLKPNTSKSNTRQTPSDILATDLGQTDTTFCGLNVFLVFNTTVTWDNCVRAQKRTNGQTIEKVQTQSLHTFDVRYCNDIDKKRLDNATGSMGRQPHKA